MTAQNRRLAAAASVGALLALVALAGCGTVSKAECQAGDWDTIGFRDGRNGESEALFARHAESCARFDLPADKATWMRGRERGLVEYCTPLSGYANAVAGKEYKGVCSGERGGAFLDAYGIGREVGLAREAARRADDRVSELRGRLRDIEDEIDRLRSGRDEPGPDRRNARSRLVELQSLRLDAMSDLFAAEREAAAAEAEADRRGGARTGPVPPALRRGAGVMAVRRGLNPGWVSGPAARSIRSAADRRPRSAASTRGGTRGRLGRRRSAPGTPGVRRRRGARRGPRAHVP